MWWGDKKWNFTGIQNAGHAAKRKNGWMNRTFPMKPFTLWNRPRQRMNWKFNTSGQKYREPGVKEKVASGSDEELLDLLASDGMLIKRPLAVGNDKATVGFKEDEYTEKWQWFLAFYPNNQ
jgi:hypothetical protein